VIRAAQRLTSVRSSTLPCQVALHGIQLRFVE